MTHPQVKLAYTQDTLPVFVLDRMNEGHKEDEQWTAETACQAVGIIDDEDADGYTKYFLLFEDGPGPSTGVLLEPKHVRHFDPLSPEAVAADPTGTGEGGIPPLEPGKGATQITKVYLVDRKYPVLVQGELEQVRDAMWREDGAPWVQFQRVEQDGMVSADDVVINPSFVVSLSSERLVDAGDMSRSDGMR